MIAVNLVVEFEEAGIEIVETIRSGEIFNDEQRNRLVAIFDKIKEQAQDEVLIPKRLSYAFQVLRDNLIGALTEFSGNESDQIAVLNSVVDSEIEDILLG